MRIHFRLGNLLLFSLIFALLLDACGLLEPGSDRASKEVIYRTPKVDYANGATVLPDGNFLVYGFTEGHIGAGDWTNAFPLLLFMDPNGTVLDTVVYRDIRYGDVIGAAPFEDEVTVLVESALRGAPSEPNNLTIYLLEADRFLGEVIYSLGDSLRRFLAASNSVIPTRDNGLLLLLSYPDDDLIKIKATGEIAWTFRMSDVQFVRSVAQTGAGDILVLGVPFSIARLNPGGQLQWQKTYPDPESVGSVREIVAVQDGAAVLGCRFVSTGVETLVLTRIDRNGELLWERTYDEGKVSPETLTALPDGGFVFGWTQSFAGERAELVRVTAGGDVLWRYPFGSQGTTRISRILTLANDRIAVVGVVGPEHIEGYGGDDFDVLVMLLDDK